jgi:hypothetical protein
MTAAAGQLEDAFRSRTEIHSGSAGYGSLQRRVIPWTLTSSGVLPGYGRVIIFA